MPKAVKNVKKLHRAWSVQAMALAAVTALQEALPIWEPLVPDNTFAIAGAIIGTIAIVLRGIDQGLDDD